MKKIVLPALTALLIYSCKNHESVYFASIELIEKGNWNYEEFKSDYVIQFPDNYSGGYFQDFEGGWFDKLRDDSHVHMTYLFSNGLQSFDFGETLADEQATSI